MRKFNLLFAALLLSFSFGCGFHLRGDIHIPADLKILAITPDNPNEELQRNIRRTLKKNGATLVSSYTKNTTKLDISEPTFSEQVLAVNNNNLPERLKLQISFEYSITDSNNKPLINSRTIKASRDFSIDPNNILSADSERNIIKSELYQDAVIKLMRQISKVYREKP